jgi:hypothetical protein
MRKLHREHPRRSAGRVAGLLAAAIVAVLLAGVAPAAAARPFTPFLTASVLAPPSR